MKTSTFPFLTFRPNSVFIYIYAVPLIQWRYKGEKQVCRGFRYWQFNLEKKIENSFICYSCYFYTHLQIFVCKMFLGKKTPTFFPRCRCIEQHAREWQRQVREGESASPWMRKMGLEKWWEALGWTDQLKRKNEEHGRGMGVDFLQERSLREGDRPPFSGEGRGKSEEELSSQCSSGLPWHFFKIRKR